MVPPPAFLTLVTQPQLPSLHSSAHCLDSPTSKPTAVSNLPSITMKSPSFPQSYFPLRVPVATLTFFMFTPTRRFRSLGLPGVVPDSTRPILSTPSTRRVQSFMVVLALAHSLHRFIYLTIVFFSFNRYYTSQYPPALPSVSVGTFSPGGLAGYSVIFDKVGAGTIFSTQLNTNSVLGNPNGSLITLAKTQDVDMSGIKLTDAAIPVTMSNVGYLLDKVNN